jgi:alcohol dehydrogenase class IV
LSPRQRAERLVESVEKLCESLGIPRSLNALGVRAEHISDLVNGSRGNSLDGNPRDVSNEELQAVLESML